MKKHYVLQKKWTDGYSLEDCQKYMKLFAESIDEYQATLLKDRAKNLLNSDAYIPPLDVNKKLLELKKMTAKLSKNPDLKTLQELEFYLKNNSKYLSEEISWHEHSSRVHHGSSNRRAAENLISGLTHSENVINDYINIIKKSGFAAKEGKKAKGNPKMKGLKAGLVGLGVLGGAAYLINRQHNNKKDCLTVKYTDHKLMPWAKVK